MSHEGVSRRTSIMLALGAVTAAHEATAATDRQGRNSDAARGLWSTVDTTARALVAKNATPGLSISVLRNGQFLYSKGFGFSNLETRTAASPRSVYLIGSITKQFTAAAVMLLAEAGKLSVDDALSKFFPDFPRGDEITLRQMLAHTSGLGDFYNQSASEARKEEIFKREARLEYSSESLYRALLTATPLFAHKPDTVYEYSNSAYALLGLLVQKMSGTPNDRRCRNNVPSRAGLKNSSVDDAADVVIDRASGYAWHEGNPGTWENAGFISRSFAGGAGDMRSTTEDLCRWHQALFGGQVVSPESLKEMSTPNRLRNGELPRAASGPDAGQLVQYGFGLEIKGTGGRQTIGHHGSINGYTGNLISIPAEGISIAILTNTRYVSRFKESEDAIWDAVMSASARAR